jgi:ppGpp synthetase/RelA/SpoT-type nucleotidyltranferase
MLPASKSRIDKAGNILSSPIEELTEEYLLLEDVLDKYRECHLQPLTAATSKIQHILNERNESYYIAQRLKRKPQILRKLKRLSVRLTQLQDIGGLRIIVNQNDDVDRISKIVEDAIASDDRFLFLKNTDYRPSGRDDSGYRALHKIIKYGPLQLELQVRSRAQHYWSESVERTSVFYGKRIKEGEGSNVVRLYFKNLSQLFSRVENGQKRPPDAIAILEKLRDKAEEVIRNEGHSHLMDGYVNEDVIRAMLDKEKSNPRAFNNWILVFDWSSASFVTWDIASSDTDEASAQYSRYEREFPEGQKYEVVLIGSSDIATVQKTHSHYFGLAKPDKVLEDLGQSVRSFSDDIELDYGAKKILDVLVGRKTWGEKKGIQRSTLQNHFCKDIRKFDQSIRLLIKREFVVDKGGSGVTLNIAKAAEIESSI